MALLEQSGIRAEPGATCIDGIAELVSGMGVVLEKAVLRAGSSHQETREVRRIFRHIVRGMSRNRTED